MDLDPRSKVVVSFIYALSPGTWFFLKWLTPLIFRMHRI